ncbi:CCNT2 [Branchiostoma lanceolatum]|uniref:CCNT2 protein n=2 Tax=Branchiostoma lanceolatum TaxID=7740 RepID=A0A8J9YSZ4_BRALA|nr:CCNT2 [Branchiostoma lanceolatum]
MRSTGCLFVAVRVMAAVERWHFTPQQLMDTPTRKCGVDADKELSYRQQAANLIQDMGQRLTVNQLCINTAIVYMHRFYMYHSFTKFHRNALAAACLFLAAKVEEQPRKLEHVIRVAHVCLHRDSPNLDTKSETYLQQAQDLVINESILLQTLGFEVAIDHPHTHVVKTTQLIRGMAQRGQPTAKSCLTNGDAPKDLAQTAYFMATNSLHLTAFSLQYKPTVVACMCIHLACKWASWEIPRSNDGKYWWEYVDPNVTLDLLDSLTTEFLHIMDKTPSRLKRKISNYKMAGDSPMASIFNAAHTSGKTRPKPEATSTVSTATASGSSATTGQPQPGSSSNYSAPTEYTNHDRQGKDGAHHKAGMPPASSTSVNTSTSVDLKSHPDLPTLPPLVPPATKSPPKLFINQDALRKMEEKREGTPTAHGVHHSQRPSTHRDKYGRPVPSKAEREHGLAGTTKHHPSQMNAHRERHHHHKEQQRHHEKTLVPGHEKMSTVHHHPREKVPPNSKDKHRHEHHHHRHSASAASRHHSRGPQPSQGSLPHPHKHQGLGDVPDPKSRKRAHVGSPDVAVLHGATKMGPDGGAALMHPSPAKKHQREHPSQLHAPAPGSLESSSLLKLPMPPPAPSHTSGQNPPQPPSLSRQAQVQYSPSTRIPGWPRKTERRGVMTWTL